jgi:SAM-dependent methyltransferase
MDIWKFYDITHRNHIVCNPLSLQKIDTLIDRLPLQPHSRVLDIATGKGEFFFRLCERYKSSGIGVDLSPYHIKDAQDKLTQRNPGLDLELLEMDGAKFKPANDEKFDLASCLGASWIWGGYKGTLTALKEMVKPGGFIVSGEPFWIQDPPESYLKIMGLKREDFGTHAQNVKMGEELGLFCAYTLVSDLNDWDNYETTQWDAAFDYIRDHPEDSDNEDLVQKIQENKYAYLDFGRECLGWAVYVFRNSNLLAEK